MGHLQPGLLRISLINKNERTPNTDTTDLEIDYEFAIIYLFADRAVGFMFVSNKADFDS
jgi:hypothetical protein